MILGCHATLEVLARTTILDYSTDYQVVILSKIKRFGTRARGRVSRMFDGIPDLVVTFILVCVPLLLLIASSLAMTSAWSAHSGQTSTQVTTTNQPPGLPLSFASAMTTTSSSQFASSTGPSSSTAAPTVT